MIDLSHEKQEAIENIKMRIENAREYNWEGGFDQQFVLDAIEEHFNSIATLAAQDGRDEAVTYIENNCDYDGDEEAIVFKSVRDAARLSHDV